MKPKGYWTKERCLEDAKKYNTVSKWKAKYSAFVIARRNGWLDECCKHMVEKIYKPRGYWTKEHCLEDAKKYNTRSEWEGKSSAGYSIASKNGWLDECCKHMKEIKKPGGYWTKEQCIEDAKKHKTRLEWKFKSGSAYASALRNGWLEECCKHMEEIYKPKGYWTKDRCIEVAKKYKTRTEWSRLSSSSYTSAQKNNWRDECCKHMEVIKKPDGYWTKENCIKDAKKYKTRNEWWRSSGSARIAQKNNWLEECCRHMEEIVKPAGYWTKDRCIEVAKKYKTRTEWQKGSASAYKSAFKNNWLKDCCKHMVWKSNKKQR